MTFLERIEAIYDPPDYRRMSIPLPDEADGFDHPIDFTKRKTLMLAGLEFVLERQGAGHQFHNIWAYHNKKTKLFVLFAKRGGLRERPDTVVIDHHFASARGTIPFARLNDIMLKIASVLKRKGYPAVRITGPNDKRVLGAVEPQEADAILVQRTDPDTGTRKWALVSRKKRRVLKWFDRKPSAESVRKQEQRIQYFKHRG